MLVRPRPSVVSADRCRCQGTFASTADHISGATMSPQSQCGIAAFGMATDRGCAMKRVVVERFGGPEVLRVVEEDDPRPGRGEVRVRVLAAGVSFTDSQL